METKDMVGAAAIFVSVLLAITGYLVAYANSVRLERRKATMKFVSDQLQYLYGPLFSLSTAADRAWISFRSKCRPGGAFFGREPLPTEAELTEWRLWMSQVFMPINLMIEKAIVENAHLVEGEEMPNSFQELLAHVEVYKAVVKRWETGDFREHASYINFPEDLATDVARTFKSLKRRQTRLIGS